MSHASREETLPHMWCRCPSLCGPLSRRCLAYLSEFVVLRHSAHSDARGTRVAVGYGSTNMKKRWTNRDWQRRGAILGAVLLVLATGLCLVQAGHATGDDGGMSPDLCVLMLAVSLSVVLLPGPLLSGWTQPDLRSRLALAPVHASDPPPKSLSLS